MLGTGLVIVYSSSKRDNYVYDNYVFSQAICFRHQCARFNKLTSVFHASVLLLIMNFVITLSK